MSAPETPAGPLAVDRLLAAYLGVTGVLALVSLRPAGMAAGAGHAAAALVVLRWAGGPLPKAAGARFLRAVYPVALTPLLYMELAFLNRLLTEGYLDGTVLAWEEVLFGAQLSLEAGRRAASFWLSEFLHVGYFAYYLIVPTALLGVFATRGAGAAQRVAFQTALAFFASYVVFVVFPVAGPRYLFPPISDARADGTVFGLVHAVLEGGSSKGTAFPSSHIAAAWAAVLGCRRADRRWSSLLAIPAAALAVGTVYGRFHYGVDAVAGVALALIVHGVAPTLVGRLGDWPPSEAPETGAGARPGNPDATPGIQSMA